MGFEVPSHIPLTPMLEQYSAIKRQYPDAILFYRMGDFYELFFDDAVLAAPLLEVQLTSRDKSSENSIPMCGVPHHALLPYMQKLLAKGHKVAICDQIEDPAVAKGIVKRDVTRVVTPALIGDPDLVPTDSTHWLVSLSVREKGKVEVSFLDLLAGEIRHGETSEPQLRDLFYELSPREILIGTETPDGKWFSDLVKIFPNILITKRPNYFKGAAKTKSLEALKSYFKETQKQELLPCFDNPSPLLEAQSMQLDATTLHSLEVLKNISSQESASLFHILDFTLTPMGRRTLKQWLAHPLGDKASIEARHDCVAAFLNEPLLTQSIRDHLKEVRDLERLTTKTALGLSNPRDIVWIREILKKIPSLQEALKKFKNTSLTKLSKNLDAMTKLVKHLEAALDDEPSLSIRDGNIFRTDFTDDISTLRGLTTDAKSTIAQLETREKEKTGISSLKFKFSRVFGYTIEVTNSHLSRVPKHYIRKQTIANGERYITEELKSLEEKMLNADQRLKALEETMFLELRHEVGNYATKLFKNAKLLAELDVLLSFSCAAKERGFIRPKMHTDWNLEISEGRHPVIESILPMGAFIPNSMMFDETDARTWIITGPNMGGKSTIMRQVALISLMAQAGSFVPAKSASLPVLDAIFTRIGSSDDLARGRSTFMVEMTEVSRILDQATEKSLVLIDEIGRGTSTYDGLAIAWSLLEYIHEKSRCKTLFATHFHELTQLERSHRGLRNANVLVERNRDEVLFLYRLGLGPSLQSLGIHVAKMAGLPDPVVERSKEILGLLEAHSEKATRSRSRALEKVDKQMAFFPDSDRPETPSGIDSH